MLTLLRAEINSEACQSGEAGAIFIPAQICTEAISRSLWKMHLQHEREESFSIPGSQSATCADAISSRVSNACSSLKWKKGERWYSRLILRGKWPDVTTDGTFPPPLVSDKKRKNLIHTQLHILLSFHLLKISCEWEPRGVGAATQGSSGFWQARGGADGVGGGDDGVAVTSRAYLLLPAVTSVWRGQLMRTH